YPAVSHLRPTLCDIEFTVVPYGNDSGRFTNIWRRRTRSERECEGRIKASISIQPHYFCLIPGTTGDEDLTVGQGSSIHEQIDAAMTVSKASIYGAVGI